MKTVVDVHCVWTDTSDIANRTVDILCIASGSYIFELPKTMFFLSLSFPALCFWQSCPLIHSSLHSHVTTFTYLPHIILPWSHSRIVIVSTHTHRVMPWETVLRPSHPYLFCPSFGSGEMMIVGCRCAAYVGLLYPEIRCKEDTEVWLCQHQCRVTVTGTECTPSRLVWMLVWAGVWKPESTSPACCVQEHSWPRNLQALTIYMPT